MLASCSGPKETATSSPEPPVSITKESLYRAGHQRYLALDLDSASILLQRAHVMDSAYLDPIVDLAQVEYDLAMRTTVESARNKHLRSSQRYYVKAEQSGKKDSDTYERLCELSVALNDDKTFLTYAKKNAQRYPYERQYFNLGLAYFNTGDFQGVITSQKEAVSKFPASTYVGSFHRQLGRAYEKVNRDQTAARTFDAGLKAVDQVVARRQAGSNLFTSTAEYKRLMDDKAGMLTSLKKLHTTYRDADKLQKVEKELAKLKEQGFGR